MKSNLKFVIHNKCNNVQSLYQIIYKQMNHNLYIFLYYKLEHESYLQLNIQIDNKLFKKLYNKLL